LNRYDALADLVADMKRREFIALIGSAVATPLVVQAQQSERIRRIGVLMAFAKDNPEGQARIAAFLQELQRLGWTVGRNLQIEDRWDTGDLRKAATELVASSLDVILASATPAVAALQQATSTVPIVIVQVAEPVSAGFVASLAKPGGNITGFTSIEYSIGAKWLELLKEIAPHVTRVGVIRDPTSTSSIGQFAAIQSATRSFGVEVSPIGGRDAKDIEHTVTEFARGSNCGLISAAAPLVFNNSGLIISLAARHRLPATYPFRVFVADGGLISYGPDSIDPYRQAAGYVDRILKGEKPADLPVQGATKFELVINLKTAKALGLNVPSSLLSRANDIIE
jgi:putative ABC transport system substrate-binding protein